MRLQPHQLLNASPLQRFARAVDGLEGERRPHRDRVGLEARSERHEQHAAFDGELAPLGDKYWRRAFAFGREAVSVFRQVSPHVLRVAPRACAFFARNRVQQQKRTLLTTSRQSVARSRVVVASTPACGVAA